MLTKRNTFWFVAPIAGLVLCMLVFGGTMGGQVAPEVPSTPAWFDAPTDLAHVGVSVLFVDEEESVTFFQERFRDREADVFMRGRFLGESPSVVSPASSAMPRDRALAHERGANGASFGGPEASRERSGWGWLADDVQQSRGDGGIRPEGTGDWPPRLRPEGQTFRMGRFGDDEGFGRRRWLDE